jgi:hypothetical protein
MASKTLPPDFHWVLARFKCSVSEIFQQLDVGIRDDVEKRQTLADTNKEDVRFSVSANISGSRFSVSRLDNVLYQLHMQYVYFERHRNEIQVLDNKHEIVLRATLTLNNEGECKLKVGDEELDQWQFRRKALEELFFSAPPVS